MPSERQGDKRRVAKDATPNPHPSQQPQVDRQQGEPGESRDNGTAPDERRRDGLASHAAAPQSNGSADGGRDSAQRFPIVGLGASAGGIEAFISFFENMPSDSGMGFVVVLHLSPDHPSGLADLLARRTKMPVAVATEGARVQPNSVLVIPPNATMTIKGGVLRLSPRRLGVTLPIDDFFTSLAQDQEDWAVCIVLSGTGADGTLGLRAVKEHGGLTIAQEPGSARYEGMPRSAIPTGLVDLVLPIRDMPARLLEYSRAMVELRKPLGAQSLDQQTLDVLPHLTSAIRSRTGHDFSEYRRKTVVRRVQRRMQVLRVASPKAYLEQLRVDPEEVESLFKEMLIGVTHFFRDPQAFESLAKLVIAPIVEHKQPDEEIRIWSPACASGEETYSLAILVSEELERRKLVMNVRIFAGDIDSESLDDARQGRYPLAIEQHVSPQRLERWFTKRGQTYQVAKSLREMCIFSAHNLIRNPPFSRLDLICCRNFLIYLEGELQGRLMPLFHYALRPGGYLFLGSAESIASAEAMFRTLDSKHRIFQRKDAAAVPPFTFPLASPRELSGASLPPSVPPIVRPQAGRALEQLLLARFAPAAVLVNGAGEVLYISGRTGAFLDPASGPPPANIVNMARPGLRYELRLALHRAAQTRAEVVQTDVRLDSRKDGQRINLIIRPVADDASADLFMVIFEEPSADRPPPRELPEPDAAGRSDGGMLEHLEGELRTTKERLQSTVEALEVSNEELRASNEELLSINEELQSANEELQVSGEEMQSLNEELETVNSELHAKIGELNVAYDDLQNLFQSTNLATVFIDKDKRIKRYTPAAVELFRLIRSDIGRPVGDLVQRFHCPTFLDDLDLSLRHLSTIEREAPSLDSDRIYRVKLSPYKTTENKVDGVVLTFVDITPVKQAAEAKSLLASIVEWSEDAIISKDADGAVTAWNRGAERLFGFKASEMMGKSILTIVPPDYQEEEHTNIERLRHGKRLETFRTKRLHKDGRTLDVAITIFPVLNESGEFIGASKVARDISAELASEQELCDHRDRLDVLVRERTAELQRTHERMRHAERMAALGTLSAGIGHDMGNLLLPVMTRLDSIERGVDSEQRRDDVETIRQCIDQLRNMVKGLRMLATDPDGPAPTEKLRLRAWWDDIQAMLRIVTPRSALLEARISEKLPPVRITGYQLSQAVFNLVQNASDAVKNSEHGRITVWAEETPDPRKIRVGVTDNGVGMTPEVAARCMEPFFSTKPRGISTGLGLALVQGIAQQAGGKLSVDSRPGEGATFVLTLPAAPEPTGNEKVRPTAAVTITDLRTQSYIETIARSMGFDVLHCDTPPEDAALWIGEAGETFEKAAEAFVKGGRNRCVISIGEHQSSSDGPLLRTTPLFSAIRGALIQAARRTND